MEEAMENEISVSKPRKWVKRLTRILILASVSVVVLLLVAQTIWVFAGSNQWKFVGEQNGVKVYTLKSPGSDLVQAKAVFRVHSSLTGIVKFMQSEDTCKDVGCYEERIVDQEDDQLRYDYFRMDLPAPFRPRDFSVRVHVYQSPRTKEVMIDYSAAPGKVPLNDCCVRVTDMNDTWRLTPLGNGEVEIELIMNLNEGGFIPHPLLNMARPKVMYGLSGLQSLFSEEKYQSAKLNFIQEK
jgi:hypothetical protein